ncbi:LOW QUALITY PROTEIN: hypothetical protein HID58_069324, partial [Brassica napus]
HGSSNGTLFLRIADVVGVKLTVTCSTTKNRKLFERHNLPNFPNTFDDMEHWCRIHGPEESYGNFGRRCMVMGWDRVRNGHARRASWPVSRPSSPVTRPATRPCSPGELARVAAVLAGRAGLCHGRARRRLDRQHGHARRASWLVSRPCSPGELARVTAELAGDSTGNTAVLAGRAGLWNIGVVSTDPKRVTETSDENAWLWDGTGFGMVVLAGRAGPCHGQARRRLDRQHGRARRASWLVSRPCSPGELTRVTAELAGDSTGNTAVLAGRAGSCRGRARRASWPMSRPSSSATRPATRPCLPGELACVAAELTGRSVSAVRFLGF